MIYIYGLHELGEPVTHIRYIGQTINPKSRLISHWNDKSSTAKTAWIGSLHQAGKSIGMVILDSAEDSLSANAKENAWILFVQKCGWDLTNGTNPGEHRDMFSSDMSIVEQAMMQVEDYAYQLDQVGKNHEAHLSKMQKEHTARLALARKTIDDLQSAHDHAVELVQESFAEIVEEKQKTINLYGDSILELSALISDLNREKTDVASDLEWEKKKLKRYRQWQKVTRRNHKMRAMMIDAWMSFSALLLMAVAVFVSLNYLSLRGVSTNEIVSVLTTIGAAMIIRPTISAIKHQYAQTRKELRTINLQYKRKLQKLSINGVVKVLDATN